MGTTAAPNIANVHMGRFEENFVHKIEWFNYLVIWLRFIDDIFALAVRRRALNRARFVFDCSHKL